MVCSQDTTLYSQDQHLQRMKSFSVWLIGGAGDPRGRGWGERGGGGVCWGMFAMHRCDVNIFKMHVLAHAAYLGLKPVYEQDAETHIYPAQTTNVTQQEQYTDRSVVCNTTCSPLSLVPTAVSALYIVTRKHSSRFLAKTTHLRLR